MNSDRPVLYDARTTEGRKYFWPDQAVVEDFGMHHDGVSLLSA